MIIVKKECFLLSMCRKSNYNKTLSSSPLPAKKALESDSF